ncbi:MAG: hypothetical protein CL398_07420 [Acidiferrobacteraceae bacterium]|nr:hypothetical protein [Acidiferrobacteraceae bacterium]
MKYDPVSLFDILLFKVDEEYQIDIAPSKEMVKYCTDKLNAHKSDTSEPYTSEETYAIVAAGIIEFAHKQNRKN